MKIFITAAWATQSQRNRINSLKTLLDSLSLEYYSPKDDNIFDKQTEEQQFYDYHIDQLRDSTHTIAFADELIARTAWEIGFAGALYIPVILASASALGDINLFIVKSGVCVVQSAAELTEVLDGTSQFHVYNWTGTTNEN